MASYRSELFTPDEPACNLRSTGEALLAVPKSRLKSEGDRALCHKDPSALPEEIRLRESLTFFKQKSLLCDFL